MNQAEHDTKLNQLTTWLQAAGDPIRIRIICILFRHTELCVGDIAEIMHMSMSAISHHLQILKDAGLLMSDRKGQTICYGIAKHQFTKQLKKMLC